MDTKQEVATAPPPEPLADGPILTISQFEERHPGTKNRMRGYILRSDIGMADYIGLGDAVIRLGRSVMLNEAAVLRWLRTRTCQPRSRGRNPHGKVGKCTRRVCRRSDAAATLDDK